MSKQNPETFQIGDTVTWTSQAGGNAKTKTGKVKEVIPALNNPEGWLDPGFTVHRGGVAVRDHESYLIQVGKSKRLYWPLVKHLERVEDECDALMRSMPDMSKTEPVIIGTGLPISEDDDPMWPGEGCGYDAVDVGDGSNPDL